MVERIKTLINELLVNLSESERGVNQTHTEFLQTAIYKLQCMKNEISPPSKEEEIEAYDISFHKDVLVTILKEYCFEEDADGTIWTRQFDDGEISVVFEWGSFDNFFLALYVRDEETESGEYSISEPECFRRFMDNLTIPTLKTYSITVEGQAYSENEFYTWACEDGIFAFEDSVKEIS